MKQFIFFITIVSHLSFFTSCKTKKEIPTNNLKSAKIHLSKFACLGKCEVYTLNIAEDQQMIFNGRKNVRPIGKHQAMISEEEFQSLLQVFEKGKFKELENEYLSTYTDLPRIKIEYDGHGVFFHKQVAPKELIKVLEKLELLKNQTKWKSVQE